MTNTVKVYVDKEWDEEQAKNGFSLFTARINYQEETQLMGLWSNRRSPSEPLLGKVVLKIRTKFTGDHPCQSAISIKLLRKFKYLIHNILNI